MTTRFFRDSDAARRWLSEQAGTIAALREYGSEAEVDAAVAEYDAVAEAWPDALPADVLPWYVELAIVAQVTAVLIALLWLAGAFE
jgi:hypothetical protein